MWLVETFVMVYFFVKSLSREKSIYVIHVSIFALTQVLFKFITFIIYFILILLLLILLKKQGLKLQKIQKKRILK